MITCFGIKAVSLVPRSFLTYRFIICLYRSGEQQQSPCNDICKLQKKKKRNLPSFGKIGPQIFHNVRKLKLLWRDRYVEIM